MGRSASEWVAKGGRLVDVALSASSIRDETGRVVGLALVARDISGRKLDEEAVRRYAGRLESLHAIDQTILSARPLEEVAGSALRHLARFVPVWHAGVVTFRPGDEQALVIASLGSLAESRPVGSLVPTRRLEASPTPAERQVRTRAWLPLSHHGEVFGSLELASDRPDAFTPAHLEMAQEVADLLSIAIEQAMLYEQVRLSKENLASISRRLIRAEEDVRRRISRELHDEIGQALSVLKIQLQNAGLRGEGRSGLVESVRLVERTLGQVRDLSLDLRPSLLDDMGLASALRSLLRRLARAAGFRAEFRPEGDGPGPRYDPELETACYRVAQEALTNAARHAGAGVVSVELVDGEDRLTLVVRDDGSGFDPDEALALARDGASLGLVGMGERVALLGGRFEIVSAPGKGTLVRASFPCPGRRSI
ncbi:MAG: histidine kinase [Isosphaeraceae bacterium]